MVAIYIHKMVSDRGPYLTFIMVWDHGHSIAVLTYVIEAPIQPLQWPRIEPLTNNDNVWNPSPFLAIIIV
jgi:hypothetical protein